MQSFQLLRELHELRHIDHAAKLVVQCDGRSLVLIDWITLGELDEVSQGPDFVAEVPPEQRTVHTLIA